ncbi:MAG: response regulator transcription factor [Cyclobacteriaceae bacterium]
MKAINVAIVDDHTLFRKGLGKLINPENKPNKFTILFEAGDGIEMQEILKQSEQLPDIIVMDIDMPRMDGYEAVNWLKSQYPFIKILVISTYTDDDAIGKMLKYGINGYLGKGIELEDMYEALDTIAKGNLYYLEEANSVLANLMENNGKLKAPMSLKEKYNLDDKDLQLLRLICSNETYQVIAEEMNMSHKTVDARRGVMFKKFEVNNRTELALFAVKYELVDLDSLNVGRSEE